MKHRALAGLLAVCLLLAGCGGMEDSYVWVKPHTEQRESESQGIIQASNYDELCTALTNLIDSGLTGGKISLADYSAGQIKPSMERAIAYAVNRYPTGAYAVKSISWEPGISGGKSAVSIAISYSRTPAEIDRIQWVSGMDGAKNAIYSALDRCESSLVLKIAQYELVDFTQLVETYALENPNLVMETPEVAQKCYPETGDSRIVELSFRYQTSRETLRKMQKEVQDVFDSARDFVTSDWTEQETAARLYAFLAARDEHYDLASSITPAYSLLCYGVGDSRAFATVYAAMCRQMGMECMFVTGTRDGEPWTWNIVLDNGIYYHVDLLRCMEQGEFREQGDLDMVGYVWNYSDYPPCGAPGQVEIPETVPEF